MYRALASTVLALAPTVAFANCPPSLDPTSRLNCLNRSLNTAAATISSLQTQLDAANAANAALEARIGDDETSVTALGSNVHNLALDVADLSSSLDTLGVTGLSDLFSYLTVDTSTNSLIFSGANVYVQSGSGATDGTINGLGNLIVGYDEDLLATWGGPASDRTGSHNLVVGMGHSYSSYGGLISGTVNSVDAPDAAVIAGFGSIASGANSAVVAGQANEASGDYAATLGGRNNSATGEYATVAGGQLNESAGDWSSILGGQWLTVTEDYETSPVDGAPPDLGDLFTYLTIDTATNSVIFSGANVYVQSGSGATDGALNGLGNLIIGYDEDAADLGTDPSGREGSNNLVVGMGNSYASYGGFVAGFVNTIEGPLATVTGGTTNTASGDSSVVEGGSTNHASGGRSTISGGYYNFASGAESSVLGGEYNTASGSYSTVSGGGNNVADGTFSAILGGYLVTTGEDYETYPE